MMPDSSRLAGEVNRLGVEIARASSQVGGAIHGDLLKTAEATEGLTKALTMASQNWLQAAEQSTRVASHLKVANIAIAIATAVYALVAGLDLYLSHFHDKHIH